MQAMVLGVGDMAVSETVITKRIRASIVRKIVFERGETGVIERFRLGALGL
jgi:hypothetical protein